MNQTKIKSYNEGYLTAIKDVLELFENDNISFDEIYECLLDEFDSKDYTSRKYTLGVKGITPAIANTRKKEMMNLNQTNPQKFKENKQTEIKNQQQNKYYDQLNKPTLSNLKGKITPSGKKITDRLISKLDINKQRSASNRFQKDYPQYNQNLS